MLRYELTLPSPNNKVVINYGFINLPDNGYGADMYLWWRKRGFQLKRIANEDTGAEA